jgi:hypothetical protein
MYITEDPTCYLRFSTDKDAGIVFWQRIAALIVFGIRPSFLGILVLAFAEISPPTRTLAIGKSYAYAHCISVRPVGVEARPYCSLISSRD